MRFFQIMAGFSRLALLRSGVAAISALAALASAATTAHGQGIFLTGAGPINQSMGGAAVAAPLDSAGALNWNPASISGLTRSEMAVAIGVILPETNLSSQAFGMAGSTEGQSGVFPIPTMSFVVKTPNSPLTWGVGVYGIGGFSANFPASSPLNPATANPILTPQPPNGFGVGRVFSLAQIYQIAPTVSLALTDNLSFGVAPTIDLADVQADPMVFAPPSLSGGAPFYGPGAGTRYAWGGGYQLGIYYQTEGNWRFGASYKSQQWFEPLHYNSTDAFGNPVFASVNFELPSITSVGASYTGIDRLVWAIDVRYFDYYNAAGFNGGDYRPDGSVSGLGWRSVVGVSNGLQYSLTDRIDLRAGYTYIENPIGPNVEQFNLGSALIMQNFFSLGGSFHIRQNIMLNVAWTHGFEAKLTGPYQTPAGPIPNTSITNTTSADQITAGVTVKF